MASRRQASEDWSPSQQTRIQTRAAPPREPRDECLRLPKTTLAEQRALRPMPLSLPFKHSTSPPIPKAPPPSRKESPSFEGLRDPEIVDVESTSTWPRREPPKVLRTGRLHSPSIASQQSQQSGRQSEISLGILDYYMRDPSPTVRSPEFPPTPKVDKSADLFDFGIPPTPTPHTARSEIHSSTKAGAERKQQPQSPPSPPRVPPDSSASKGYSLFPVVKQVTPPARQPAITIVDSISFRDITPSSAKSSIQSHTQPDPSYRPRKESVSSSVRSRTDSINSSSFRRDRKGQLLPLRILSGGSTPSTGRTVSTATTIALNSSPDADYQSRWSDDTITSPSMAPTPGPRTSFGSLLQRNDTQYPDCFFEDDNEEAPLRRKFAWKRSVGSNSLESRKSKGRFDKPESVGDKFTRLMFCGCGGR
jgi:Wiskott-Aldrich syndrome protein